MKANRQYIIPLLLSIIIFSACKKEPILPPDDTPDVVTPQATPVYAGYYDSTYTYQEYPNALEITVTWDSMNLYGYGDLDLDLDQDAAADIQLQLYLLNKDSLHLLNGQIPHYYSHLRFYSHSNTQAATAVEGFPLGLGQTGQIDVVDTLLLYERIDNHAGWSTLPSEPYLRFWLDGASSPGIGPGPGPWFNPSGLRYLGVRLPSGSSHRYGWVEMDLTNAYQPKVLRWALR